MFQKTARLLLLIGLALFLSEAASAADGPYSFFPLTPCRIIDTRGPIGRPRPRSQHDAGLPGHRDLRDPLDSDGRRDQSRRLPTVRRRRPPGLSGRPGGSGRQRDQLPSRHRSSQ